MSSVEHHPVHRILGVICYLTSILYLAESFYHNKIIIFLYSILGLLLLAFTIFSISKISRVIVAMLLFIGWICIYIEKVPVVEAIKGFGENMNLLSLFLLIPLIGTYMSTAGYLAALKQKVQEREDRQ